MKRLRSSADLGAALSVASGLAASSAGSQVGGDALENRARTADYYIRVLDPASVHWSAEVFVLMVVGGGGLAAVVATTAPLCH